MIERAEDQAAVAVVAAVAVDAAAAADAVAVVAVDVAVAVGHEAGQPGGQRVQVVLHAVFVVLTSTDKTIRTWKLRLFDFLCPC